MREITLDNGVVFKDCTSYSRSDKERIPTAYEAVLSESVRIIITNAHIHYRPSFIMHCYKIGIDTRLLNKVSTHKEAAELAYSIAKKEVEKLHELLK